MMVHQIRKSLVCATLVALVMLSTGPLAFGVDKEPSSGHLKQTKQGPAIVTPHRGTAAQMALVDDAKRAGYSIEWDGTLSVPGSIRGADLSTRQSFSSGLGLLAKGQGHYDDDAVAVMDNLSGLFRISDATKEFKLHKLQDDRLGFHHVRLKQEYQGIMVEGGDVIVHFDKANKAYQVNGRYIPDISLSVVPTVDATQAVVIAQADLSAMSLPTGSSIGLPGLVVYATTDPARLAYAVVLTYKAGKTGPGRWRYWIDATDGAILQRFNDIENIPAPTALGNNATITGSLLTGEGGGVATVVGWYDNIRTNFYLYNTGRVWIVENVATSLYADANTFAYRGTSNWGTSDRVELSAARNFDITLTYYSQRHGLFSFSGTGSMARANVHQGDSYVNAYWDGSEFYFGDGDNVTAGSLAVLDVCGHEFTHAVTEYSAALEYSAEPGALNESFSDIMGTCVEFFGQPDDRAGYPGENPSLADWLVGEDSWLSATALRDMRCPSNTVTVGAGKQQPTRYQGTYWDPYQEVHQNCGVQNFFFYLLSDGGSGNNDGLAYDLTGIGITNAEKIAFRALTVYCTPNTGYSAVRGAWVSAAMDLNPAWVDAVGAAWDAVGVQAVYISPAGSAAFSGSKGGSFSPTTVVYTITNSASAAAGWGLSHTQAWVNVAPVGGSIAAFGSRMVTVTVTAAALSLPGGTYADTIVFTNSTTTMTDTRQVTLLVLPPIVYEFDLSTNPGWTTEGQWAYGTPTGQGGDPTSGATGTKVYGYNLSGAYPDDMPIYALTTPALDCSGYEHLQLSFMRWLGVESAFYDHATVQVSMNGVDWTDVWDHSGASIQDTSWQQEVYSIDVADWQETVYVRWLMGPTDPSVTFSGWNIDDIRIHGTPRDDMRVLPGGGLSSLGYAGGPFSPTDKFFSVVNGGTSSIVWTVSSTSSWITVDSVGGTLPADATSTVSVALNPAAATLNVGTHTATVVFSNSISGVAFNRAISLTVQGDIAFDSTNFEVGEAEGIGVITVHRDGHTNLSTTVVISTSNGTATAGSDYTATNATLTFAPGDTLEDFIIQIQDDNLSETSETVNVVLSNPTGGATVNNPSVSTLTIQDDDAASIALPYNLYDGRNYRWDVQRGGSIDDGSSDAFDGAFVLSGFSNYSTGLLVSARQVVIGPMTNGNVRITRKIYVPMDQGFCRFLEIVENIGLTSLVQRVRLDSNLGSDNGTVVDSTSSGDATFSVNDHWIVTDDGDGTGDPTVAHIIGNSYGQVKPAAVSYSTGVLGYEYNVPLNAGETKIIMHFGVQCSSRSVARTDAANLTDLNYDSLDVMTPTEISQIANFGVVDSANNLITDGDPWLYHSTGAIPGTNWQGLSFSDGSWLNGLAPLGYGDPVSTVLSYGSNGTNKWATYYFRKHITVTNLSAVTGMVASFVADDGAVLYLNGTRIRTSANIIEPAANDTWTTGAAQEPLVADEFTVNPAMLVTGDNVVAAEVHQVGPGSSDVYFDMSLTKVAFATTNQVGGGFTVPDNWTAYNDAAWQTDDTAGVTGYYTTNNPGGLTNGTLLGDNGQALTGRTVSMATNAALYLFVALPGTATNVFPAGTDVAAEFAGHIGGGYACELQGSAPLATVTVSIAGLSTGKQYKLVVWSSRLAASPAYTSRYTDVVLSGVDSFTNTSTMTDGVTRFTTAVAGDSTTIRAALRAGYGPVTRFEQIRPGSDGIIVFKVSRSASSAGNGYLNAFKLVESDLSPAGDTDSDGMPDSWENRYYGGTTNANPAGNSDGDPFSNYEEYLAGTNPTNSGSFFEITGFNAQSGMYQVVWMGGTNGATSPYGIFQNTNLFSSNWVPAGYQIRQEGTNVWLTTAPTGSLHYYYRITATN